MKADIHHSGMRFTLVPQIVETAFYKIVKIARAAVSLRHDKSDIVVGQRIGHDQMARAGDFDMIGEIVVIGVGVVNEAAFLDQQFARVDRRTIAAIPAKRPLTAGLLERFDGCNVTKKINNYGIPLLKQITLDKFWSSFFTLL